MDQAVETGNKFEAHTASGVGTMPLAHMNASKTTEAYASEVAAKWNGSGADPRPGMWHQSGELVREQDGKDNNLDCSKATRRTLLR
ncbi:hypothetical protein [Oryza sativa Japonica Group]|uniref:Uncharacterized protein n=1 Tax=Oryza sativa subsp. japonica TaxID=39947 RepID=Q5ZBN7_ORYSJ|nr:hypothetical protein [Oryza sativa Japonica Group]BAD53049.1 hypothetical protein [Oryza sativa Japonica Group]